MAVLVADVDAVGLLVAMNLARFDFHDGDDVQRGRIVIFFGAAAFLATFLVAAAFFGAAAFFATAFFAAGCFFLATFFLAAFFTGGAAASISASTVSSVGVPETFATSGSASSIPRRGGSSAWTTNVRSEPRSRTSRALRGGGSPKPVSGT